MNTLTRQYEMIKSARGAVIDFLEKNLPLEIFTPIPTYSDKSVAYMLVHIINTYISWVGNFTLNLDRSFYDDGQMSELNQIKSLFQEVDMIMQTFLEQYEDQGDKQLSGYKSGNRYVEASILQLFTHVTTHEFHHKGQIMTMCRLLHTAPPDTDIIRF